MAGAEWRLRIFQALAATGCAATVGLTWTLWQVRSAPPLLPILPLPAMSVGIPLLAALALALVRPGAGLCTYVVVLTYAIAIDRSRVQPALVSFAFLMAAGVRGNGGPTLARVHLLTLWFYGGVNKLFSAQFMHDPGASMLRGLIAAPPDWLRGSYAWFVVGAEVGLAVLAAYRPTRKIAALWAFVLHASILLAVASIGHDWNQSVWPWNVVLALSGILLIAPWRESLRETLAVASTPVRIAAVALLLYPLGFYVGLGDPYLAHNLYSRNTPSAYVCNVRGRPQVARPGLGDAAPYQPGQVHCRLVDFLPALNVPEPPEHRVFEDYFARTCTEDEMLMIYERRLFYTARGQELRALHCSR